MSVTAEEQLQALEHTVSEIEQEISAFKVRENKARRALSRRGLALVKSKRRDTNAADFGLYRIENPSTNMVIEGAAPNAFSMTLADVEEWLGPQPEGEKRSERTRRGLAFLRANVVTIHYLATLPKPGEIPTGKVLVHNHVKPASRRMGNRGSRSWLQAPDASPTVEPCDCGFAPELGQHYRVAKVQP
jgi:hypothetical protein